MEQQYEDTLNEAIGLFEKGYYDDAVASLIQIYNAGHYREQIKTFLYQNFISPNEDEYKRVYFDSLNHVNYYSYDSLAIDFIAVSDRKYYLFDKIQEVFLGALDFDTLLSKRDADCDMKKDVRAVLVSNVWDIRIVIENIYSSIWNGVYMICEDKTNYLFSFLKIPEVNSLFFNHVVFFEKEKVLCQYFRDNETKYLPRIQIGNVEEKYGQVIEQLHRERIEKQDRNREGVLVSFCIPSYNRGGIAYENVMNYLQSEYDAEIEIVLSNNGTEENTEGYDKLAKIQDSRLVYHRMSENKGFLKNQRATIQMANGKFIVMSSDEDFIDTKQMVAFLNVIINTENAAVIKTGGIGENFESFEDVVYDKLNKRLMESMNTNYITGLCFNNDLLKKHSIMERIEKHNDNAFYRIYPHTCIVFLLCQYASYVKCSLSLWLCKEAENSQSKEALYRTYCNLDSRITQQNESIRFIIDELTEPNKEALIYLFEERIAKSYHLMSVANILMGELFKEKYTWMEICLSLHKNNIRMLEQYEDRFTKKDMENLKGFTDEIFVTILQDDPQMSAMTEEEKEKYENQLTQIGCYYKKHQTFKGFEFS